MLFYKWVANDRGIKFNKNYKDYVSKRKQLSNKENLSESEYNTITHEVKNLEALLDIDSLDIIPTGMFFKGPISRIFFKDSTGAHKGNFYCPESFGIAE